MKLTILKSISAAFAMLSMCFAVSNVYANDGYPGVVGSSWDGTYYRVRCSQASMPQGAGTFWRSDYLVLTNGVHSSYIGLYYIKNNSQDEQKKFLDVFVGTPYCYGLKNNYNG